MFDKHMYYQNVRGLRTKANEFLSSVVSSDAFICCVTETWLNNSCYSFDYFTPIYEVFRNDRLSLTGSDVRGGGILIAVRKCPGLHCHRRFDLEYSDVSIWVEIVIGVAHLLIGTFYFPPNTIHDVYSASLDCCSEVLLSFSGDIFMFGDFNLPCAQWDPINFSKCTSAVRKCATVLSDFTSIVGLHQLNSIVNFRSDTLDLCFSNIVDFSPTHCSFPYVLEDPYHPALSTRVQFKKSNSCNEHPCKNVRNFSRGDYESLYSDLSYINWTEFYDSNCVNFCAEFLCSVMDKVISDNVPLSGGHTSGYPGWFSVELRHNIVRKRQLHRKYKRLGSLPNYVAFSEMRRKVKRLLRRDRECYFSGLANSVRSDPKRFWKAIKPRYREAYFDVSLLVNGELVTDGSALSDIFCKYYSSVVVPIVRPAAAAPVLDFSHFPSNSDILDRLMFIYFFYLLFISRLFIAEILWW